MRERRETLSLSFLSFLPRRERPLLAGKSTPSVFLKIFELWGDVLIRLLISTSAPSHWLKSVAWPAGPVLKFRDIPDWSEQVNFFCSLFSSFYTIHETSLNCAFQKHTNSKVHKLTWLPSNHLSGPLRKQKFTSTGSKGHGSLVICDW